MKLKLTLTFVLVWLFTMFSFAQEVKVAGVVSNESGIPLAGVTILVKGMTKGTMTDFDGRYSIMLSGEKILVFSYLGMNTIEKKVSLSGKKDIRLNIIMRTDAEELDDVVVVGYGKSMREALTGSASVVKKDVLEKAPTVSVEKALQATSPGLQVANSGGAAGSGATIRIRGIGSLKAGSSPLWVVDGVVGAPIPSTEDIESVTVLKDAAASSIYGSRAANGVILVTTKSGKNGRTSLEFQSKYSISSNTINKFKLLNSADFYKVSWQGLYAYAKSEGKSDLEAAVYAHNNIVAQAGRNPYNVAQPYDDNGNLVPGAKLMIDESWYDLAHRNGSTIQHDLSANGGNEKTKFYFSLGYYDQDGIVKPDFYSRYTLQANISNQVTDKLKIGFRTTLKNSSSDGVKSVSNGSSTGFAGFNYPNNVSLYELDKDFNVVYGEDGRPLYNWNNKVTQDSNPIGLAELNRYYAGAIRGFASVNLSYEILENLIFNTNFSADYSNSRSSYFENKAHGDALSDNGRSKKDIRESFTYISSTTLTYDKRWNRKHHINTLLGYETQAYKGTSLSAMAKGYEFNFSDELSVGTQPKKVGSSTTETRMIGVFSRLNYDFNSKYYTSFSIRKDASSKFAPDRRWGTFWSASASWRLTQEKFLKETRWLDNLKLKVSYGTNGNAAISPYLYLPLYSLGGNYNGSSGLVHTQLESPQLRWEKNIMTNIGLEFGLFGFLDGYIEWFNRASDDLLSDRPLPYSSGWSSRSENIGALKNTGIELSLNSTNIKTKKFSWTTSFNISHYKNEITSLSQDQIIQGAKVWKVGGDVYSWYMPEYAGVDRETGKAQWFKDVKNGQGNITGRELTIDYAKATRYVLGSSLPDFYGGLTNTFTYHNLSLGVQFYYSVGGKIYDSLEQMTMSDGGSYGYQLNAKVLNAWRPDNKDSNIPQFIYNNTTKSNSLSSRFLYDGSFLRLRNVSLSYDMPSEYLQRIKLQSLRLFLNAENMYTFTKYEGLDPEQGISGNNGFSTIPNVRTFTLGIRVGF